MEKGIVLMSKYTTEVRYICEHFSGLSESVGYNDVEQVIKNCLPKVFDFDFPIFDENYRTVLETKILRHYYTREIGLETVGLWKLKLSTKLNEIMPYYNKLYKSELLNFNPLYDVDVTVERKIDTTGQHGTITEETTSNNGSSTYDRSVDTSVHNTDSSTDASSNNKKQMYSDTPQGSITDLEGGRYLTNATIDDSTGSVVSSGEQNGNSTTEESGSTETNNTSNKNTNSSVDIKNMEDYIENVKGKQGGQSFSSLLMEFRETFLNIDMMVINDLEELFFGLW